MTFENITLRDICSSIEVILTCFHISNDMEAIATRVEVRVWKMIDTLDVSIINDKMIF
jgi:hypothetical protein